MDDLDSGSVSINQVWRLKGVAGAGEAAEAGEKGAGANADGAGAAAAAWEKSGAGAGAGAGGESGEESAAPVARWRHSACVFQGGAFVFGGNTRDKEAVNLNDVWRLDLDAAGATWEEVPTTGGGPSRRHDHSAVLANGEHMVGRSSTCHSPIHVCMTVYS